MEHLSLLCRIFGRYEQSILFEISAAILCCSHNQFFCPEVYYNFSFFLLPHLYPETFFLYEIHIDISLCLHHTANSTWCTWSIRILQVCTQSLYLSPPWSSCNICFSQSWHYSKLFLYSIQKQILFYLLLLLTDLLLLMLILQPHLVAFVLKANATGWRDKNLTFCKIEYVCLHLSSC